MAANDPEPRYVVREITGYSVRPQGGREATVVRVADMWYCGHTVQMWAGSRWLGLVERRRQLARELCDRLNAEHEEWLRQPA